VGRAYGRPDLVPAAARILPNPSSIQTGRPVSTDSTSAKRDSRDVICPRGAVSVPSRAFWIDVRVSSCRTVAERKRRRSSTSPALRSRAVCSCWCSPAVSSAGPGAVVPAIARSSIIWDGLGAVPAYRTRHPFSSPLSPKVESMYRHPGPVVGSAASLPWSWRTSWSWVVSARFGLGSK
jgi:hypothetical protein